MSGTRVKGSYPGWMDWIKERFRRRFGSTLRMS